MRAITFLKALHRTAVMIVAALLVVNVAWAQQKFPINTTSEGVKSNYVQQHVIDVGDVTGHQVRILEVHRVHSMKQIVLDGVKVVEEWDRGFSDYTNGVGPARGYAIWVLEDGNKVFLEWNGTAYSEVTATGSKRGTFHGTQKIVGGTGKFAKIRGMTTDAVEFDTVASNGYSRASNRGEYWFEQ
ncbi:MAG TPA: hypothetical protein VKD04_03965 [Burkholderiales bacterium]|nr:hypothetical protein [Burkholderiales bacterium]